MPWWHTNMKRYEPIPGKKTTTTTPTETAVNTFCSNGMKIAFRIISWLVDSEMMNCASETQTNDVYDEWGIIKDMKRWVCYRFTEIMSMAIINLIVYIAHTLFIEFSIYGCCYWQRKVEDEEEEVVTKHIKWYLAKRYERLEFSHFSFRTIKRHH